MPRKVIVVSALVVVCLLIIVGYRVARPYIFEWQQRQTSDSAGIRGKVTIASDNWIGYFPLCSPEMKNRMRAQGYQYDCVDDGADYPKRMARLKSREINLAVATVDSYVLNAAREGFPAVMTFVIDESKGGDAVVAWENVATNINAIRERQNLRIAFTPHSPSHHLIKAAVDHFDVPSLLPKTNPLRIETKGSPEALKAFLEKKADVAVLWEPDVARALQQKGVVKILGTESTRQLIVDVFLVNRDYAASHADAVKTITATYFQTLKVYRDDHARLVREVVAATKVSAEKVEAMLKGVAWATFAENNEQWFGIGSQNRGLIETIEAAVSIMTNPRIGDFKSNPLPEGDPNRIVWGRFLEELVRQGPAGFTLGAASQPSTTSLSAPFGALDERGWQALRVVGSLKVQPITFRGGTADLNLEGKAEIDSVAEKIKHYPAFRILVKGHTSTSGDPEANLQLSQDRAESVGRYLTVTYGVDPNRIHAIGVGSREPLARYPNESDGAHEFRLRRVEVALLTEVY